MSPPAAHPRPPHNPAANYLLVLQACAAQLAYGVLAMLVWAPLLVLTAIFYPVQWAWFAFALLSLITWWLLQPSVQLDDPILTRSDAPRLFALLDTYSQQLNAPRIDEVRLTDELNAGAMESRGFLGLLGNRRTLLLGIPLLHVLNEAQASAVIGHELGHFSKRHGRMGHWVYRVRLAWSVYLYAAAHDDEDSIDRMRRWVARLFLPGFIHRSSVWSKQCEYEADACAAEVAGAQHILGGLARMQAVDQFFATGYARAVARCQQTDMNPPADYWAWVNQLSIAHAQAAPHTAPPLRRPPPQWDTHPQLNERATALGHVAPQPHWDDSPSAGQAFLGDAWATHFAQCNQEWSDAERHGWRLRHVHLNRVTNTEHDSATTSAEKALEQTVLTDELEHSDASLHALEQLAPHSPVAHYHWGQALLRRGKDAGIDQVRAAIRSDRRLALQGYEAILSYVSQHGTLAQIQEYDARLNNAWDGVSLDGVSLHIYLQRATLAAPPAHWRQLLGAALADVPVIDGMWIVSTDTAPIAGETPRKMHIAFMRQEPVHDPRAPFSDALLMRQVRLSLLALAPPTDLVQVSRWFSTEAIPPKLLARLQALPGCEVLPPRTAFNQNIVRIDSL